MSETSPTVCEQCKEPIPDGKQDFDYLDVDICKACGKQLREEEARHMNNHDKTAGELRDFVTERLAAVSATTMTRNPDTEPLWVLTADDRRSVLDFISTLEAAMEEARKERDSLKAEPKSLRQHYTKLWNEGDTLRTEAKRLREIEKAAQRLKRWTETKGKSDPLTVDEVYERLCQALSPPTDPATTTDEMKKP